MGTVEEFNCVLSTDEYVKDLCIQLKDVITKVKENLEVSRERMMVHYNQKIVFYDYRPDEQIWLVQSFRGSSLENGELEMMLHRRTLMDDGLGVEEPLSDPTSDPTRGTYRMFLSRVEKSSLLHRLHAGFYMENPIYRFAANPNTVDKYLKSFQTTYSGLTKPLPANVRLLTLETNNDDTIILRFEHVFARTEDIELSKPVQVSLKDLFREFDVTRVTETNLSANQILRDKRVLQWTKDDKNTVAMTIDDVNENEDMYFVLKAMQIRTFIATVDYR